jgi:hypothetical protein
MKILLNAAFLALGIAALTGCEGKKVLDKCDGFFQQGCKAPLQCMTVKEQKVCINYCDTTFACKDPKGCCPSGFTCQAIETRYTKNGTDIGSGGTSKYCVPQ